MSWVERYLWLCLIVDAPLALIAMVWFSAYTIRSAWQEQLDQLDQLDQIDQIGRRSRLEQRRQAMVANLLTLSYEERVQFQHSLEQVAFELEITPRELEDRLLDD